MISIADQVFEELERDILSGVYERGEILTEMQAQRELGVSRTPIREALRRLEQEHIIESTSKGARVIGISAQDIADIREIRLRLEGLASRWAAERCPTRRTSRPEGDRGAAGVLHPEERPGKHQER